MCGPQRDVFLMAFNRVEIIIRKGLIGESRGVEPIWVIIHIPGNVSMKLPI
jgi:hypothetical protein